MEGGREGGGREREGLKYRRSLWAGSLSPLTR